MPATQLRRGDIIVPAGAQLFDAPVFGVDGDAHMTGRDALWRDVHVVVSVDTTVTVVRPTRRAQDAQDAAARVVRAWTVEGEMPRAHRAAQASLRRTWPSLAATVAHLVKAARR